MIICSEEIYNKANSIVKSCGTRDTLKIARELGIYVHQIDTLNDSLGMYTYRHSIYSPEFRMGSHFPA